jgi:hypothetical protein
MFVAHVTRQHHDPVYQCPDAETAAGEQLSQGDAIVAQVPPARAKTTEKDLEQPRHDLLLVRVGFPGHWMAPVRRCGVGHRRNARLSWIGLSGVALAGVGLSKAGLAGVGLSGLAGVGLPRGAGAWLAGVGLSGGARARLPGGPLGWADRRLG